MAIEPIKIPQNVHIEDRIVGPLTLKQILIVGAGAGFSYALYGMLTNAYGALALPVTIMVWIPAGIAAIFAFIRINDISMFRLVLLMIEQMNKPSVRTWTPRRGITINIRTFHTAEKEDKNKQSTDQTKNTDKLEELSMILDHPIRNAPETPAEEPRETDSETLIPSSVAEAPESPRLPVDRSRVTVSSAGTAPRNSIFHDISAHA